MQSLLQAEPIVGEAEAAVAAALVLRLEARGQPFERPETAQPMTVAGTIGLAPCEQSPVCTQGSRSIETHAHEPPSVSA